MRGQELGQQFPHGEAEEIRQGESARVGVVVQIGRAGLPSGQELCSLQGGSCPDGGAEPVLQNSRIKVVSVHEKLLTEFLSDDFLLVADLVLLPAKQVAGPSFVIPLLEDDIASGGVPGIKSAFSSLVKHSAELNTEKKLQ